MKATFRNHRDQQVLAIIACMVIDEVDEIDSDNHMLPTAKIDLTYTLTRQYLDRLLFSMNQQTVDTVFMAIIRIRTGEFDE